MNDGLSDVRTYLSVQCSTRRYWISACARHWIADEENYWLPVCATPTRKCYFFGAPNREYLATFISWGYIVWNNITSFIPIGCSVGQFWYGFFYSTNDLEMPVWVQPLHMKCFCLWYGFIFRCSAFTGKRTHKFHENNLIAVPCSVFYVLPIVLVSLLVNSSGILFWIEMVAQILI